ncbi:MAG: type 1 glutamine amidotransferase [Mycobacteriaceae bacterium]
MTPRILVVEHEHGTGPGFIGETLTDAGLQLDLQRPYRGDPLPQDLSGHHGLIVLGGTPNPYDDAATPWLPAVRALLAEALDRQVPTLGICLGGEILAMVAGGQVRRATRGVEVGIQHLTVTDAGRHDPLFAGLPAQVPAVEWHVEEIAALPPGSVTLCSSDRFPNQAFRVGTCAWGTQFHPEVLTDMATAWAEPDSAEMRLAGLTRDALIAGVTAAEPELTAAWGHLARRWAALVQQYCTLDPTAG